MKLTTDEFMKVHNSDELVKAREEVRQKFFMQGGKQVTFDMWLTTMRYEVANELDMDPSELTNDIILTFFLILSSNVTDGKDSENGKEQIVE